MPLHFLKVSPTLSCTPKNAHPRLLQSRGAAGALLRLPDNPNYTKESIFFLFPHYFLWLLPLLSKRVPCKLLCPPGLCMVSVGKADGSTSSGFAFTMELIDGFLDDAHTVAHQWLTNKENSNQSCTWGKNCLKVTLLCIVRGSVELKIISEKATMPGRAPQPSFLLIVPSQPQ